jgi:hypothetical protein
MDVAGLLENDQYFGGICFPHLQEKKELCFVGGCRKSDRMLPTFQINLPPSSGNKMACSTDRGSKSIRKLTVFRRKLVLSSLWKKVIL